MTSPQLTATPMSAPTAAPAYRIPAPQGPRLDAPIPVPARSNPSRPSRATYVRRRVAVVVGAVLLALTLVLTQDAFSAEAGGGAPTTAGHVVVEPGQTLWDIAAAHAPAGSDLRDYLLRIEQLNGVRADAVDAWDVVLLPAIR